MNKKIIKRNGEIQDFDFNKIKNAVNKAFKATTEHEASTDIIMALNTRFECMDSDTITVEQVQDIVEKWLMENGWYSVAKAYILYREKHKELRFIKDRVD